MYNLQNANNLKNGEILKELKQIGTKIKILNDEIGNMNKQNNRL